MKQHLLPVLILIADTAMPINARELPVDRHTEIFLRVMAPCYSATKGINKEQAAMVLNKLPDYIPDDAISSIYEVSKHAADDEDRRATYELGLMFCMDTGR